MKVRRRKLLKLRLLNNLAAALLGKDGPLVLIHYQTVIDMIVLFPHSVVMAPVSCPSLSFEILAHWTPLKPIAA